MTDHYIVVPAIDTQNTREFLRTMNPDIVRERVILVDNSEHGGIHEQWGEKVYRSVMNGTNKGVAWAWNYGMAQFVEGIGEHRPAKFLTLASTSIRFHDGAEALCRTADVFAQNDHCPWGFESMNGWKLFTVGHRMKADVGCFDEKFFPAYYEDNDYIWRCRVAGIFDPQGWYFEHGTMTQFAGWQHDPKGDVPCPDLEDRTKRKVPWIGALDYEIVGDAMALKAGLVEVDFLANSKYYERKWGGQPGEETSLEPLVGGIRR